MLYTTEIRGRRGFSPALSRFLASDAGSRRKEAGNASGEKPGARRAG